MARKEADQFEQALRDAAQGKAFDGTFAPLIHTAQLLSALAKVPPPPPDGLSSGRHQFLSEAARLRAHQTAKPGFFLWRMERLRLVGALIAAILVFGLVFGMGQATASSLPGQVLYDLKLSVEATRMRLTTSPEARADLAVALVGERLDEIATLVAGGQVIDEPIVNRTRGQLALACRAIGQVEGETALRASQRLASTLQGQHQSMILAASTLYGSDTGALRDLLQEIDRVRQQLHTGSDESNGEQYHFRYGTPRPPAESPGSGPGPRPTDRPVRPQPTEDPGSGPGPQPTDRPVGPQPTEDPGSGPGPQPTDRPAGPQPTDDPGSGPGPQPTDRPAGPQPTDDPGSGPGPQPTDRPAGPQPTDDTPGDQGGDGGNNGKP